MTVTTTKPSSSHRSGPYSSYLIFHDDWKSGPGKPGTAGEEASPIDPDENGGQVVGEESLTGGVDVEQEAVFVAEEVARYRTSQL